MAQHTYQYGSEACDAESDAVIVETMPDHLRSSHRAARNWGVYPVNGAERRVVSREEADQIVADDADEYDHIVCDALVAVER